MVSLCAALLGVSLVLKRYSMIGDGLSHVGFFALAVASVAGVGATYSLEVSVPIVILAAVLILRLSHSDGKLNGDAACAVVSAGAVAVGTLMYNVTGGRSGDVCNSLFGSSSVITISNKDMLISLVLSCLVLLWFLVFTKNIFSVTFDETFARAAGVKTGAFNIALAVLTGMQLTKSFKKTVILSAAISLVCFTIGFFAACCLSLQTGAAVVTVELAAFALSCVGVKIRGIIYKSRAKH